MGCVKTCVDFYCIESLRVSRCQTAQKPPCSPTCDSQWAPLNWLQQYLPLANYFLDKYDIIRSDKFEHLSKIKPTNKQSAGIQDGLIFDVGRAPCLFNYSANFADGYEQTTDRESTRGLLISGDSNPPCNSHTQANQSSTISESTRCRENEDITSYPYIPIPLSGKSQSSKKPQYQRAQLPLALVLLSLALICCQNAQPSLAFGDPEHDHDSGLSVYHLPRNRSPLTSSNFWQTPNNQWHHNSMRNLNDDPMGVMSSSTDSLSNDPETSAQGSSAFSPDGWTSMITSAISANPDAALDNHIKRILIPRVSGTPGNVKVREYIAGVLRANNYQVELDEFTQTTPIGKVKFANIIADSNPKACRQLVLACHHDSKLQEGFLGAVDSAVPCAMLLRVAENFNKSFRPSSGSASAENPKDSLGLRFVFFDGEEAFVQWSATDSLYGSRHLASKWEKQPAPPQCRSSGGANKNELSRIEMMMLLDLIGTSDTSFVMYNMQLKSHYNNLQKYEKAYLARQGVAASATRRETAFKGRFIPLDFVEDDHVPFKQRGVPILSLLAHPFPKVWHTNADNYEAIDFARTRRILHVIEEFVSNYSRIPE